MTDLVWQEDDGRVVIWYMDGTTKTAEIEVGINPGAAWRVVGTGDLDDDGCSDIVFQNGVAVAVWPMDGAAPRLTESGDPDTRLLSIGTGSVVAVAGANVYLQTDDGPITVWTMGPDENGDPSIISTDTIATPAGAGWRARGVDYFNGDVVVRHDGGTAALARNDGSFYLAGPNPGLTNWQIAAFADLDASGRSDVIWEVQDAGGVRAVVWLIETAEPGYAMALGDPQPLGARIALSADFDEDGKFDLLWQADGGPATVWLMGGATVLDVFSLGVPA